MAEFEKVDAFIKIMMSLGTLLSLAVIVNLVWFEQITAAIEDLSGVLWRWLSTIKRQAGFLWVGLKSKKAAARTALLAGPRGGSAAQ